MSFSLTKSFVVVFDKNINQLHTLNCIWSKKRFPVADSGSYQDAYIKEETVFYGQPAIDISFVAFIAKGEIFDNSLGPFCPEIIRSRHPVQRIEPSRLATARVEQLSQKMGDLTHFIFCPFRRIPLSAISVASVFMAPGLCTNHANNLLTRHPVVIIGFYIIPNDFPNAQLCHFGDMGVINMYQIDTVILFTASFYSIILVV